MKKINVLDTQRHHAMAAAFVVGDKFRDEVKRLLEKTDSALPPRLRDELEETLATTGTTTLSFGTARQLRRYLQEQGEVIYTMSSEFK